MQKKASSAIKTFPPVIHAGRKMWSMGVVVDRPRGFVFLSGTTGRDPETDEVVEGYKAQTLMCWKKIKERLEAMGSSLDNIILRHTYVTDLDAFFRDGGWEVYEDFIEKNCPNLRWRSAGTLVEVKGLHRKDMLIEIEVVAVLPEE